MEMLKTCKIGVPGEKPFEQGNDKQQAQPAYDRGPHWWEAIALFTDCANPTLHGAVSFWTDHICYCYRIFSHLKTITSGSAPGSVSCSVFFVVTSINCMMFFTQKPAVSHCRGHSVSGSSCAAALEFIILAAVIVLGHFFCYLF